MTHRTWDATTYHRVSSAMDSMAQAVLERLAPRHDETVLDAGCGTGRITALLRKRVPRGRVIGVDASADMVARAREHVPPDVKVIQADLTTLRLDEQVDAVFSTATFHWILDHDLLFARLFDVLRPGGRLVAQCGGEGNIAGLLAAAGVVASNPEYASAFEGWERPHRFAGPDETTTRLERAGFTDVHCWLQPHPVVPDEPLVYLRTLALGAHLDRLPSEKRDPFVAEVAALLPSPLTIDYVRLDIDARRPA